MISRSQRSDAEGAEGTWITAPDAELNRLTDLIIGAAIEVHRHTGPGLMESAYEECLCYELSQHGIHFKSIHAAQLLTYLKLSSKRIDFLLNFNEPVLKKGIKRMVNHFEGKRPGNQVPSAPSARQPHQTGAPSTDGNLLKTPRLRVSAVNINPPAVK